MKRCCLIWLAIGRTTQLNTQLDMKWDVEGYNDQRTQKMPVLDDLIPS